MPYIKNFILLISSLFLISCGENTTSSLKDIQSIKINEANISMYTTDSSTSLTATAIYTDGSTADITKAVAWSASNTNISVSTFGLVSIGSVNSGDTNISISYDTFKDENISIHLIPLTDFNITMVDADVNSTGDYNLLLTGKFEDNATKTIVKNISWDLNNSATVSGEGNTTQIQIVNIGETNITATMFAYDNDFNLTKSIIYSAN